MERRYHSIKNYNQEPRSKLQFCFLMGRVPHLIIQLKLKLHHRIHYSSHQHLNSNANHYIYAQKGLL